MEPPTIFYSWQSDTTSRFNHRFIENCLLKVAEIAPQRLGLPSGIVVHRDTTGVPGLVAIPETIFGRIDKCAAFVGDITFVGQAWPRNAQQNPDEIQKFPNANVILELGYAAKTIGWKRIIGIMNDAFGKPEEQIFHFTQHRWPLTYSLMDKTKEEAVGQVVVEKLSAYIEESLREEHAEATRVLEKLNSKCLQLLRVVKGVEYFSHDTVNQVQDPNARAALQLLFEPAVDRLLTLGAIRTHLDARLGTYAYHWTYLGTLVKERV